MSQEGETQMPPHARDTLITSEGFATKQITEMKQSNMILIFQLFLKQQSQPKQTSVQISPDSIKRQHEFLGTNLEKDMQFDFGSK